jgi:hypothetical protein
VIALPGVQRNPYKGDPPRPWIRLQLRAVNGSVQQLDLLADTGNPFPIVISEAHWLQVNQGVTQGVLTNFGLMPGGWVEVVIPELGFDELVTGYGNDAVAASTQASSPDFGGLIGLPLLRMMRYGGDADFFWVESESVGTVPK